MAVAPGFINMLSHSYTSILHDPRSLGELKQGVTLQVFGEGHSMGSLTPQMRDRMNEQMEPDIDVEVCWLSLAEYLAHAEKKGVSQNIASYIGATTLRIHAMGQDDRPATSAEMDVMRGLVRDEMSAGAPASAHSPTLALHTILVDGMGTHRRSSRRSHDHAGQRDVRPRARRRRCRAR